MMRVSGEDDMNAGSNGCARRRTESSVGSVVVFDVDSMESRLGAAVGMSAMGGDLEEWRERGGGYLGYIKGRSAMLIDVGVEAELLMSMHSNDQEIVLVETSPGRRVMAERVAGSKTRLLSGVRRSAATMAWVALRGPGKQVPALIKGTDWLRVGVDADDDEISLALGAKMAKASVRDLVHCLEGDSSTRQDWWEMGRDELLKTKLGLRERAENATPGNLAGAKLVLAKSESGSEGALSRECRDASGVIGAAWVESGDWRELTLSAADDVNLEKLCNAFGGYGERGFGRISLSSRAFKVLESGRLGALEALRLSEPDKARDERSLGCIVRDDMCIGAHVGLGQ